MPRSSVSSTSTQGGSREASTSAHRRSAARSAGSCARRGRDDRGLRHGCDGERGTAAGRGSRSTCSRPSGAPDDNRVSRLRRRKGGRDRHVLPRLLDVRRVDQKKPLPSGSQRGTDGSTLSHAASSSVRSTRVAPVSGAMAKSAPCWPARSLDGVGPRAVVSLLRAQGAPASPWLSTRRPLMRP